MANFSHLIPSAPPTLSAAEAAAYEERRRLCLWALSISAAELPEYEVPEWLLTLYRGEVAGRWDSDQVLALMKEHYAPPQASAYACCINHPISIGEGSAC